MTNKSNEYYFDWTVQGSGTEKISINELIKHNVTTFNGFCSFCISCIEEYSGVETSGLEVGLEVDEIWKEIEPILNEHWGKSKTE